VTMLALGLLFFLTLADLVDNEAWKHFFPCL
jgi:hypothetical protein